MSRPISKRRALKATQGIFIRRLQRLVRMRNDYREDLNEQGLHYLDVAINATIGDCTDYGVGLEARIIVDAARPTP